jgi:hypothetical protein
MSDDEATCGFALARLLSALIRGPVRASRADLERVVALIDGARRAMALEIAKRLALGYGLCLLNKRAPGCGKN